LLIVSGRHFNFNEVTLQCGLGVEEAQHAAVEQAINKVRIRMPMEEAGLVIQKCDSQLPMQTILDAPVATRHFGVPPD